MLEGVCTRPAPTARPVFHRLPTPTDADIAAALLTRLYRRVRRWLTRRDRLPETAQATDPFPAEEPLLATAVAAALQGRVALGPRAGQPLRRLRSPAAAPTGPRCARLDGFSLHADVAVRAHRRDQLEHRCRYLLRPPLALDRLTETTAGQLLYQLRRRGAMAPSRCCWTRWSWSLLAAPGQDCLVRRALRGSPAHPGTVRGGAARPDPELSRWTRLARARRVGASP